MKDQNNANTLSKSVTVLGLGQIGLPIVVLAALRGFKVFGVDINPDRLDKIKSLDENGMESALSFFLQDEQVINNLHLSVKIEVATNYFVISVPTYFNQSDQLVLSHVQDCCISIAPFLQLGSVVIIESTVPVGFTRKMAVMLEKMSGLTLDRDLFVAYSPERLMPGQAFKELVFNDRVIGGVGERSTAQAMSFYLLLIKGSLFATTAETAELTKITENSHRAVQIAFANQMAEVAKSIGVDPFELINLANKHPRVKIASPGIGIGGDCVPVHPLFLKEDPVGEVPSLVAQALAVNQHKEQLVIKDIYSFAERFKNGHKRRKPKILLLGLTYKPNVADVRNSPAIRIAKQLVKDEGLIIKSYDPLLDFSQIEALGLESANCFSEYKNMDLLVFLVAHDKFTSFRELNLPAEKYLDPIGFFKKFKESVLPKEVTLN